MLALTNLLCTVLVIVNVEFNYSMEAHHCSMNAGWRLLYWHWHICMVNVFDLV